MTGAGLGPSTPFFQSPSWLLLTIRRAAPAENSEFSFGGLDAVVAEGLRRRLAVVPWFVDERRLMTELICRASERSTAHWSSSDPDDGLPLLAEFEPAKTVSTVLKADGRTAFVPISRRGEAFSESEPCPFLAEEVGEPSDFFVKKPAAKRLVRGLISKDVVGGAGIGDEPGSEAAGAEMGAEKVGGGASTEELVGVDPTWSGVLWKSAKVPFSLSSRQRTPRLAF
jgi:hypothetical protein